MISNQFSRFGTLHLENGVDNEFLHSTILEILIKDKIMAIKKNSVTKQQKNGFRTIFRRNKIKHSNNDIVDKKIKIAIVELPPENNYQSYHSFASDQPVSINIEEEDLIQNTIESISLYNIEITGDQLINCSLKTNSSTELINFKSNSNSIQCLQDNQSIKSSEQSFCSTKINEPNLNESESIKKLNKQHNKNETKTNQKYEIPMDRSRKYSLETISHINKPKIRLKDSAGVKLEDQHLKLCLSDSNLLKSSTFAVKSQSVHLFEDNHDITLSKPCRKKKNRLHKIKKSKKRKSNRQIEIELLDEDDLPERARWTIIATACLLLVMCLFLVGITLRMAPLIDDIVRQENERLKFQSMKILIGNKENSSDFQSSNKNYTLT
uniref:CSON011463 protein n=1 Tax=Culicoides sonorensis TaxID=179676 RepID=A0A336LLJ8_CULSO